MRILDNMQRSLFEVRNLIQNIAEVKKLVYYDGVNALEQATPTLEQVKDHFTLSPIFDVTKAPYDKNTIISIAITKVPYDDEKLLARGTFKINVLTRTQLWELSNNKLRPLEISNFIIEVLNNRKVSSSHKILFSNIDLAILDENVNGYTLTFFLVEGSGLDGQF